MAYYQIPDPEEMIACPYDKVHMIAAKRMQYHLIKCRKNYVGREFATCPFNARHEMPKPELRYHIANCPDKAMLEPIISYEQSKNSEEGRNFKGNTELPKYDNHSGRSTENWDEEIPENPRIGVDPSFFARMEYKDLSGMSRSEKKMWKTQYALPPEERKLPNQEEFEPEEETALRMPKKKPDSYVVQKPVQPPSQVLSYSLAMAGIGRGGGAMGISPQQPMGGVPTGMAAPRPMGRAAGRAAGLVSAMPGQQMVVPPVGRGRAAARENQMMQNGYANGGMNGYSAVNGSGDVPAPPPGFSQFVDAEAVNQSQPSVEKQTTPPKPAGIGRGILQQRNTSPSTFSVGVGRGMARIVPGSESPAFIVPRVSSSEKEDNNNNESVNVMTDDEKSKEIKKIEKKLKQIELLEAKGEQGYKFNSEEEMKLKAKDKLLKCLEELRL